MMGALTQSPASAGMPPAFAALGPLGSVGGEMPAFDQLVAAAPVAAAGEAPLATILPPAAAMPFQPADGKAVAILPDAKSETVAAAETPAATDDAAAKAVTLLLAATGRIAAPVTDQVAAHAAALPSAIVASKPATAIRIEGEGDGDSGTEAVETGDAAAPAAVWMPPVPTSTAPAAKPEKAANAAIAADKGDAPALPAAAKPREAAQPAAIPVDASLPKAKIVDAGPSMTVAFTQPAAPAAGAIAEAVTAAPVAERVLDLTSDDAWIEQLARDIAATKSQSGDISFRLMPRHLGRLDIAMRQEEGGVSLKLDTQHEATATVVHAAQGRLVEDLRQQGVRVAGAEVTCTPGETGRQSLSQQGQGRGGAHDAAHLIETAPERAEARDEERAATRGGRFA
ncbi:flagellar hook-length control protein FliK [Sphingopyxis sp. J-6]|uniref:flagellar hook-length control protein FliK n=1 Tax=Sphingopyxis sp. J-6 TaxID=3122054 RepID=UPI0039840C9C